MNILYIVAYAPNRIRTRPHNLITALRDRGHQLTVATLWENEEELEFLRALEADGVDVLAAPLGRARIAKNVLQGFFSAEPIQAHYSWHPTLFREIWGRLREGKLQPDVIQAEHIRAGRYALRLADSTSDSNLSPPIIWDSVDCISYLYSQAAHASLSARARWITHFELHRTRSFERTLLQRMNLVLVTSKNDKRAYRELTGGEASNVMILPNGVDLEYFAPVGAPREVNTVVFSGKMSFHANVTAAIHLVEHIMPRVWETNPEVRVWLVGKDPPRSVCALGSGDARVDVTGTVKDIRPYLQRASLSVAPVTYGAGIQNKVIEAMACGAAVVASPQAVSALQVEQGREVVVADDEARFAEAILRLLADDSVRVEMGINARRYVSKHHNWGKIVLWLEATYRKAIQENGS